jgi:cysteine-rich repeat protein
MMDCTSVVQRQRRFFPEKYPELYQPLTDAEKKVIEQDPLQNYLFDEKASCAICGNFIREGHEECDDGNVNDNDGCSSRCFLEPDLGVGKDVQRRKRYNSSVDATTAGDRRLNEGEKKEKEAEEFQVEYQCSEAVMQRNKESILRFGPPCKHVKEGEMVNDEVVRCLARDACLEAGECKPPCTKSGMKMSKNRRWLLPNACDFGVDQYVSEASNAEEYTNENNRRTGAMDKCTPLVDSLPIKHEYVETGKYKHYHWVPTSLDIYKRQGGSNMTITVEPCHGTAFLYVKPAMLHSTVETYEGNDNSLGGGDGGFVRPMEQLFETKPNSLGEKTDTYPFPDKSTGKEPQGPDAVLVDGLGSSTNRRLWSGAHAGRGLSIGSQYPGLDFKEQVWGFAAEKKLGEVNQLSFPLHHGGYYISVYAPDGNVTYTITAATSPADPNSPLTKMESARKANIPSMKDAHVASDLYYNDDLRKTEAVQHSIRGSDIPGSAGRRLRVTWHTADADHDWYELFYVKDSRTFFKGGLKAHQARPTPPIIDGSLRLGCDESSDMDNSDLLGCGKKDVAEAIMLDPNTPTCIGAPTEMNRDWLYNNTFGLCSFKEASNTSAGFPSDPDCAIETPCGLRLNAIKHPRGPCEQAPSDCELHNNCNCYFQPYYQHEFGPFCEKIFPMEGKDFPISNGKWICEDFKRQAGCEEQPVSGCDIRTNICPAKDYYRDTAVDQCSMRTFNLSSNGNPEWYEMGVLCSQKPTCYHLKGKYVVDLANPLGKNLEGYAQYLGGGTGKETFDKPEQDVQYRNFTWEELDPDECAHQSLDQCDLQGEAVPAMSGEPVFEKGKNPNTKQLMWAVTDKLISLTMGLGLDQKRGIWRKAWTPINKVNVSGVYAIMGDQTPFENPKDINGKPTYFCTNELWDALYNNETNPFPCGSYPSGNAQGLTGEIMPVSMTTGALTSKQREIFGFNGNRGAHPLIVRKRFVHPRNGWASQVVGMDCSDPYPCTLERYRSKLYAFNVIRTSKNGFEESYISVRINSTYNKPLAAKKTYCVFDEPLQDTDFTLIAASSFVFTCVILIAMYKVKQIVAVNDAYSYVEELHPMPECVKLEREEKDKKGKSFSQLRRIIWQRKKGGGH